MRKIIARYLLIFIHFAPQVVGYIILKMEGALFFINSLIMSWVLLVSTENVLENRLLGLFEGDMKFRNGSYFRGRNAITNKYGRWPEGKVVYSLDETYSDRDREVIKSAIEEFDKHTCIRWIEKTDEDEVYVSIENDMGCWSEVGRTGTVQSLSLESPACMKKGVVMHEMMHSLGFLHEQSRPDRDDHIQVIWDNIISGMEPNFEKLSPLIIDSLGLDYDARSVMHYTSSMFANDRSQPTIRPKDNDVSLEDLGYGQKHAEFTELDIQKISKFYECPSKR